MSGEFQSWFERWFGQLFDREAAAKRRGALAVGLAAGVLRECPVCREVTDAQQEGLFDAADRLADQWIEQRDNRLAVFNGDAKEVKNLVRELRDQSDVSCTCESI